MSDGAQVRGLARTGAAMVAVGVLTGCSMVSGGSPGPAPVGPATARATAAPAPTSVSSAAPTPDSPLSSVSISTFPTATRPTPTPTGRGLQVSRTRLRGQSASARWDIAIPTFSGAAVAAEANRRVRAAAQDLIDQVRREARHDDGSRRTLTGDGRVGTNDGRTVQVLITFVDNLAGTAHPALYVTTTVVDVGRARPVLLSQVIQNPPEGLRFLRAEVVKAARRTDEPVDATGLAPKLANWANWQTDTEGMTFHFDNYQLGTHGLRSYTVPWKRARLVLSAYGEKLLLP